LARRRVAAVIHTYSTLTLGVLGPQVGQSHSRPPPHSWRASVRVKLGLSDVASRNGFTDSPTVPLRAFEAAGARAARRSTAHAAYNGPCRTHGWSLASMRAAKAEVPDS